MESDSEVVHVPAWRLILRGLGMLGALLLLSGIVMALILFVANYFDKKDKERARPLPVFIESAAATQPRTYAPLVRGQADFPNHPARPMAVSFKNGRSSGGGRSAGHAQAGVAAGPGAAVGLSVDAYRAAIDNGRKVYLHNPAGECTLGGAGVNHALDNCFAPRAAR